MGGRGLRAPGASDFNRILEAWGVRLVEDEVAGDLDTARRVNINRRGRVDVADYVLWLSLAPGNFDAGDVVISGPLVLMEDGAMVVATTWEPVKKS